MNRRIFSIALTLTATLVLLSGPARTRTWYVNISGTGDAPTIKAALDSAVSGDTVLVGPGHYESEGSTVRAGVVVVSEAGPLQTRITGNDEYGFPPPVIFSLQTSAQVHGFWMERATWTITARDWAVVSGSIIGHGISSNLTIHSPSALIMNNLFLEGGGVYVDAGAGGVTFQYNIVYCPFYCEGDPPGCFCNNILSPDNSCLQVIWERFSYDNFSADPQFCGIEGSGDYLLQSDSPCAPGNTPLSWGDCGQIGPLPVGCGPVSTEVKSWGAIKSMYRE